MRAADCLNGKRIGGAELCQNCLQCPSMLSYPSSSVSAIREHRDGSVGAPCAKRQQLGSKPWCLKLLPLASFLHLGFPSSSKFIWPSSNRLPEPSIQKTSFCHKEITPLTNSFVVLYTSYRLPQRTQPLVGFLRRLPVESSPPTVPDSQNLSLDSCQTTNNPRPTTSYPSKMADISNGHANGNASVDALKNSKVRTKLFLFFCCLNQPAQRYPANTSSGVSQLHDSRYLSACDLN